ncbi:hypothetical protein BJV74DRAFT_257965 [Russula compacta]|nr:hypothetical protein BJV74DRAFT_257965 [Russula compacta]
MSQSYTSNLPHSFSRLFFLTATLAFSPLASRHPYMAPGRFFSPLDHRLTAQDTCELVASPPAFLTPCLPLSSFLSFLYFEHQRSNTGRDRTTPVRPHNTLLSSCLDALTLAIPPVRR